MPRTMTLPEVRRLVEGAIQETELRMWSDVKLAELPEERLAIMDVYDALSRATTEIYSALDKLETA